MICDYCSIEFTPGNLSLTDVKTGKKINACADCMDKLVEKIMGEDKAPI